MSLWGKRHEGDAPTKRGRDESLGWVRFRNRFTGDGLLERIVVMGSRDFHDLRSRDEDSIDHVWK